MSTMIALRHTAFDQAVLDVYAATRLLQDGTATARRQVAGLLADWRGGAADAFATAFLDWCRAAAACADALDDIGTALRLTHADALRSDIDARQHVVGITGTLAGALR